MGRAGDARGSGRRLFAAAQSAAQGVVSAQYPARRPHDRSRCRRGADGVLVLMRHIDSRLAHRRASTRRHGAARGLLSRRAFACGWMPCLLSSRSGRWPRSWPPGVAAAAAQGGRHPRPRRVAPRRTVTERRPTVADLGAPRERDLTRSAEVGGLPGNGAARRLRADRAGPGGHEPAQRDVRPARAGRDDRHGRRFPQRRPLLPQRVLALEGRPLRSRPLRDGQVAVASASTSRASSACSARSTRT